jgi:ATP-dependent HslUV protease ATP-binding subunit HslU
MQAMTPREIVSELDRHIVGQPDAKRAVAIAVRNRWRRQRLPEEMRNEVAPKNILMIGPTGVGKTEIARRLARLTGAPFLKVEASKYTEVGYYGRDVESMVRELVEAAIQLVRQKKREEVREQAEGRVRDRILDALVPPPGGRPSPGNFFGLGGEPPKPAEPPERYQRTREKVAEMLDSGALEDREIEISVEQRGQPMMITGLGPGMDSMDPNLQNLFEKLVPKQSVERKLSVEQARKLLLDSEADALINTDELNSEAVATAESLGIIFLDEIDKIVSGGEMRGADVSRQGVQRDLLPIVEGTTVQTRYGPVKTDHMLFVAAGAFHKVSPSDLMPELQGRFPLRVELTDLTREDFLRILSEPKSALTKQYTALLETEGVTLTFEPDGLEAIADYAFRVNQTTQNIGARRLATIMERLLEEVSFEAPAMDGARVSIDAAYVRNRLEDVAKDEDLSRFIL